MDRIARECEQAMRHARDYRTWRDAAAELDRREGRDEWKEDETSTDYDWRLIRSRLKQLRQLRGERKVRQLVHHLRQGLHWNLGNIGNPRLYSYCRVGTKHLIHDYVAEVTGVLEYLADNDLEELPFAEKLKFFHDVALSYGRSALLLSGGATLGLFHVGVVKALYLEDVLPLVMSGSSAGAVVVAALGTRAPTELEELLDPEASYYHFWRPLGLSQILKRRTLMDPVQVRRAINKNVRDLTFEEAFELSGRAINITVSPAGSNQPPRLLNYLTFPYLFVREAVQASCSVPLLFPPVMLMTRGENGEREPFMPLLKWNDGSLKSDLPVLRLRRLHNVNHFVVSQTNPHVLPFLDSKDPSERLGVVGGIREYAFSSALTQAQGLLNLARAVTPVPSLQRRLEVVSSILDQNYRGNVTIMPQHSLWRYMKVAANPKIEDVKRFILEGERATWARMSQVRNQVLISQTLDRCLQRLEARLSDPERVSRMPPPAPKRGGKNLRVVRSRP